VALIPYTLMQTNLGLLKKGDQVNIEVDVIARYVAAALNR
jgi:riboflavin synthase